MSARKGRAAPAPAPAAAPREGQGTEGTEGAKGAEGAGAGQGGAAAAVGMAAQPARGAASDPRRVVVENVQPAVDGGRFPAKRCVGDKVVVEADVFADGHDLLAAVVRWRGPGSGEWREAPLEPLGNDRWRGSFEVREVGTHQFAVEGWVDEARTWRHDLAKRLEAGQDVAVELRIGAGLAEQAAARAAREHPADAERLRAWAAALAGQGPVAERARLALDPVLGALADRHPDRSAGTRQEPPLEVLVDPARARASAWYELFPRSASPEPGRHGTLRDVEERLPEIAAMGFDTLYLPPIHPIGRTHRKGRNNARTAQPGDVGSPWAIGSGEGGHKAVHPELGTLKDVERLVARAREVGIEVALDIAFQCSPDHPYVKEHPQWFRRRPDGTIQHAENPPKKYEDIVPFDFASEDAPALWRELKSVVEFWMDRGVRTFRVDNPHTKPFAFWAWLIGEVRARDPEVLFLSEAFTRPKVMYRLAKLGFTHSYTYFAWRNTKWELTEYFRELAHGPPREFFRPHLWPNTPDILTQHLQAGGRPAFMQRLILAATLGANYGIYGPAFELGANQAVAPGKEEYLDSEKYEVRRWDLGSPHSLRDLVARVNRIRGENPALLADRNLHFHHVENDQLLAFSKRTDDFGNVILVVANLDPHHTQIGMTGLDLGELGVAHDQGFQVHDLLTGARYLWHGPRNYVELNPNTLPAHVFRVRRRVASEQDFDYYA